jgi:hypothetical protein
MAVGGGTSTTDPTPGAGLLESVPTRLNSTTELAEDGDVPTGWWVRWANISNGKTVTVYAICAG